MPAKSKAQFNFMQAIAGGAPPQGGPGPSPVQAQEFVKGQSPKGLPAKAPAPPAKKSSGDKLKAGFEKMHAKKGK